MKTILITGGTDGMGKGLALHFLSTGNQVIIVGSSHAKGAEIMTQAKEKGWGDQLLFLQADLSLISENYRIIQEITARYSVVDVAIFAAASQKYRDTIQLTSENLEFVFSLMYLSRYILSYGLNPLLEKSEQPLIINIAAPGMKGTVNWDDLQFKKNYNSTKVKYRTSRLNDLLGTAYSQEYPNINYVLFNPWAVRTNGALTSTNSAIKNQVIKFIYQIIGLPVEQAILPIVELVNIPPKQPLSAYKQKKEIDLSMSTFDPVSAKRLAQLTAELIHIHKA